MNGHRVGQAVGFEKLGPDALMLGYSEWLELGATGIHIYEIMYTHSVAAKAIASSDVARLLLPVPTGTSAVRRN